VGFQRPCLLGIDAHNLLHWFRVSILRNSNNNNMNISGHHFSYADHAVMQTSPKYNTAFSANEADLVLSDCNHSDSMKLEAGNASPIVPTNEGNGAELKIMTSPSLLMTNDSCYNNSATLKPIKRKKISHASFQDERMFSEVFKGSGSFPQLQQQSLLNPIMERQQHHGANIIGKMIYLHTKGIIEDEETSSLESTSDDMDYFFLSLPPSSSQTPMNATSLLENPSPAPLSLTRRDSILLQPRPRQSRTLLQLSKASYDH